MPRTCVSVVLFIPYIIISLLFLQCLGQTWYLDNDMQMFIISPLIIYPLWRTGLWITRKLQNLANLHGEIKPVNSWFSQKGHSLAKTLNGCLKNVLTLSWGIYLTVFALSITIRCSFYPTKQVLMKRTGRFETESYPELLGTCTRLFSIIIFNL